MLSNRMLKASSFPKPVHILRLHTNNCQGTVIVAESVGALLKTFKEKRAADATDYFFGNIIDLPVAYISIIREKIWEDIFTSFRIEIQCAVAYCLEMVGEFPAGISPCVCFPKDFKGDNDSSYLNWMGAFETDATHDCVLCHQTGIRLNSDNWNELVEENNPNWRDKIPEVGPDVIGSFFVAGVGREWGERSGANILEINNTDDFPYYLGNIMCAFTGVRGEIPAVISQWLRDEREKYLAAQPSEKDRRFNQMQTKIQYTVSSLKKIKLSASDLENVSVRMSDAVEKSLDDKK